MDITNNDPSAILESEFKDIKKHDTKVPGMFTVAWFSAGVSSAVMTKLLLESEIDAIVYTHIDDQHPDTMRFLHDCEDWFQQQILVVQSPYKCVANAVKSAGGRGYINGPAGAACTRLLKKRIRQELETRWTEPEHLRYVWGLDMKELNRAIRIRETMPDVAHTFPLIDKGLTKSDVHAIAAKAGLQRPEMYERGYQNNNCIGCLKGGKAYWNKIRVDFPEVFAERAALERSVGASCINGCYLDELDPEAGRNMPPICASCGMACATVII